MKNTNTRDFRLQSMQNAQAHVRIEYDNDFDSVSITLVSYTTEVLKIIATRTNSSVSAELFASGIYSVTTARHIRRFTEEFAGLSMYYTIKDALKSANIRGFWVPIGCINYDIATSQALRYLNNSFAFGDVKSYYGRY